MPRPDAGLAAVDALANLGKTLAGQVGRRIPLMYGSDDALALILLNRERLQRHFLFLVPDADVGCALIAKDRFGAFARHRGLPVPRSLSWTGDGPGSVRGTESAVLVKPSDKFDWHHSTLCRDLFGGNGKARVFDTGAAAAGHPVVCAHHRELTFQEYIPGGDCDHWSYHGFADEHGIVLAGFVGRKLRTYPAGAGESAFIELADDPDLECIGRDVALRCPLKGPFKMDFKRDPRDGRWHLLEINARYNLWHYLGARNGVNLMRVAYEYLVYGTMPQPVRAGTRLRWLALDLDFRAYRELAARGELSAARWIASIAASRNVCNLFSASDPGPWLSFWTRRLTRRLLRGPRHVIAAINPWRSTAS
jgi:predicted ATP-grasp superfamily ATP-dependent carboligase